MTAVYSDYSICNYRPILSTLGVEEAGQELTRIRMNIGSGLCLSTNLTTKVSQESQVLAFVGVFAQSSQDDGSNYIRVCNTSLLSYLHDLDHSSTQESDVWIKIWPLTD